MQLELPDRTSSSSHWVPSSAAWSHWQTYEEGVACCTVSFRLSGLRIQRVGGECRWPSCKSQMRERERVQVLPEPQPRHGHTSVAWHGTRRACGARDSALLEVASHPIKVKRGISKSSKRPSNCTYTKMWIHIVRPFIHERSPVTTSEVSV